MEEKVILTLEEAKNYLRIDYEEDDSLLEILISSATSYLERAIDNFNEKIEDINFLNSSKILACVLVQEWYDNREQSENKDLSYISRSLLTQLQVWR